MKINRDMYAKLPTDSRDQTQIANIRIKIYIHKTYIGKYYISLGTESKYKSILFR